MTVEFFEGPAGSGKTHNLIERVRQLVSAKAIRDHQRVLALTYMNGARRRLESNLAKFPELRRRFECKTVDAFAQTIVARRRSLLPHYAKQVEEAKKLGRFDSNCFLAACLLQSESVARWVASSFPIVLLDEAQDLNAHRRQILHGLAPACLMLVAADEFQCLANDADSNEVIAWLASHADPVKLDGSRRTSQSGILDVAQAVRGAKDILPILTKQATRGTWRAPGLKLIEIPGTVPLLAWNISNELKACIGKGNVAILTPDTTSTVIRRALDVVQSRPWTYSSGATFGPFAVEWELDDKERVEQLGAQLALPEVCGLEDIKSTSEVAVDNSALTRVRMRMDRMARISGQDRFPIAAVEEMIGDAVRDVSRFGVRRAALRVAMSIHRAKNREFKNVIVLWPMSATGSDEYKRRLLYNAITRAQLSCTIIVLGEGRLTVAPFGTQETLVGDVGEDTTAKHRRPRRRRRRVRARVQE